MRDALAEAPERLPPRPDGLDPKLAAFVEALARDAARADHREAMMGAAAVTGAVTERGAGAHV